MSFMHSPIERSDVTSSWPSRRTSISSLTRRGYLARVVFTFRASSRSLIPLEKSNFDRLAFDRLFELYRVLPSVVIREDDLRLESLRALGGLGRRHRVGQVHRDECNVDVLERAHLVRALGVA